jgi:hypothetical protein
LASEGNDLMFILLTFFIVRAGALDNVLLLLPCPP